VRVVERVDDYAAALHLARGQGAVCDLVLGDVLGVAAAGVGLDRQRRRRSREHLERDHARVRRDGELLHGLGPPEGILRKTLGQAHGHISELRSSRIDEATLERGDDDEVGGAERARDDSHEDERDAGPDSPEASSGRNRCGARL
jgi:hypothetical protein